MSDAQPGLLTATPIIIAFAGALRAMGVLSTTATVFAVGYRSPSPWCFSRRSSLDQALPVPQSAVCVVARVTR